MVVGAQWGDEGKGKLVDLLAAEADLVCRCQVREQRQMSGLEGLSRVVTCYCCCVQPAQGGNNAGHTVIVGDVAYDFHLLPR